MLDLGVLSALSSMETAETRHLWTQPVPFKRLSLAFHPQNTGIWCKKTQGLEENGSAWATTYYRHPLLLDLYYWTPAMAGVALYKTLSKCSVSDSPSWRTQASKRPLALGYRGTTASAARMVRDLQLRDLQLRLGQSPALQSTKPLSKATEYSSSSINSLWMRMFSNIQAR